MENFSNDYGPFGSIWLNTSHQGALPRRAVSALHEAIEWKISPHHLANAELFSNVPIRLKQVLGRLINAPSEDIILGNSASYGLHLLANGIKWSPGEEILLIEGDFPCDILPWLALRNQGVKVRMIKPGENGLQPEDVLRSLNDCTRLLCTSWVFSFTGQIIDLPAISKICRENRILLVLNCSQGIGNQPFDVSRRYVDALTCVGHKWLCGPYGTGFCWIDPILREELDYNQAYWLSMLTADDLKNPLVIDAIKPAQGARKYDVFGTANFFNFVPLTASLNFLLEIGITRIKAHNDALIQQLTENLDKKKYEIITPVSRSGSSSIRIISHKDKNKNSEIYKKMLLRKINIALRGENLRISPHLYNTEADIREALAVLNAE